MILCRVVDIQELIEEKPQGCPDLSMRDYLIDTPGVPSTIRPPVRLAMQ
jgi:hypothetical protein